MIDKYIDKEYSWNESAVLIIKVLAVAIGFAGLVAFLGVMEVFPEVAESSRAGSYDTFDTEFAPILLLIAAFVEEVIFRLLPVLILAACFQFYTKRHLFIS